MALFLVVDDSAIIRKGVRKILGAKGYETIEAKNGNEALKMVEDHAPDCIILDLIMPEMGGIEVLKVLSKNKSKIPVIILTADIQDVVREECLELGAVAFLNKPILNEEMIGAINIAIGKKQEAINEHDTRTN
jgi:CheY-like chemotaxis protein